MSGRRHHVPGAVLPRRVVQREVVRVQRPVGLIELMRALAFHARSSILRQLEPLFAAAFEGAEGIIANLGTSAVILGAFVEISGVSRMEAGFPHGCVGLKSDSKPIRRRYDVERRGVVSAKLGFVTDFGLK